MIELIVAEERERVGGGGQNKELTSVTVFVYVDNHRFLPSEREVSQSGADDDRDREVAVVRHKDQHQGVAHCDLDHVQQGL